MKYLNKRGSFVFLFVLIVSIALTQAAMEMGNSSANSTSSNASKGANATGLENAVQQVVRGSDNVSKQVREQVQEKLRAVSQGNFSFQGKQIMIKKMNNIRKQIKVRNISAETDLELFQEQVQEGGENKTKLKTELSNGKNAEIKVMPDTASETAIQRLKLKVCSEQNNCTIELKEIPVRAKNQSRLTYEVSAEKQSKIFGLFRKRMQVRAEIDANNGEVIEAKKPWWAFLASEE
jgi:hypothetical protein